MLEVYIDADGCAVKEETYKVALRHQLKIWVVANKWMTVPLEPKIEMVVVDHAFDAADDWIVESVTGGDIVVTADILLAQRCLEKGARVLGAKGLEWTHDNIGNAVATRELMSNLRQMGEMRGGPAPMDKKARSQFLSQLDQIIHSIKNKRR